MRYRTDKPKWYAVHHPDLGVIVVECRDISTPWEIIVRDTEEELKTTLLRQGYAASDFATAKSTLEAKGIRWEDVAPDRQHNIPLAKNPKFLLRRIDKC